ncbi:MAG: tRNA preQ1(34) S-adenosylmethionine ribosyltransferase-isomerase QueA [Helicobacter sp.]|nr:tRNA preQ1(34) S-adenosylmethionine ribosyltransferase-isomerase QueA [Helicobacter sp.]
MSFDISDYDFELPKEAIALYPTLPKESGKLLIFERASGKIIHTKFGNLFEYIPKDFIFVFNDTKVMKARIFGKIQDRKIELLIHSFDSAQIRGLKNAIAIELEQHYICKAKRRKDGLNGLWEVAFYKNDAPLNEGEFYKMLEQIGKMPIPPYIKREATQEDETLYQSVFARSDARSIAAPTASLHFSKEMHDFALQHYRHAFLSLQIGSGTFKPISTSNILDHKMHSELLRVNAKNLAKLMMEDNFICVGTTALRALEFLHSIKQIDMKNDFIGECDIFIHLNNPPKVASALLTNFHLPKSSLFALISSMTGLKKAHEIYKIALENGYKFYSYGDGMLII